MCSHPNSLKNRNSLFWEVFIREIKQWQCFRIMIVFLYFAWLVGTQGVQTAFHSTVRKLSGNFHLIFITNPLVTLQSQVQIPLKIFLKNRNVWQHSDASYEGLILWLVSFWQFGNVAEQSTSYFRMYPTDQLLSY